MREPYFSAEGVTLYWGDCRTIVGELPAASVDAVVTDPPYELGFMGKGWDGSGVAYDTDLWREALRVLKPGGHLLAFGGTRTWHRLAVAIEDAGFEVRDSIAWMYGSGFPKSLDVSKAIDKAAGAERVLSGDRGAAACQYLDKGEDCNGHFDNGTLTVKHQLPTAPATPAAQQWQGWGTALKPAFEPIVVARKPLIGTVAENVLTHGTGALNIDGARIGIEERINPSSKNKVTDTVPFAVGLETAGRLATGRWPANVILDESQAAELDIRADELPARFFYVPKANSSERPRHGEVAHPTVKPLALMRYLVKLVTPPGGTVLEPFAGSGTTLEACLIEGFNVIGIELTEDYLPLIVQRLSKPIEATLL